MTTYANSDGNSLGAAYNAATDTWAFGTANLDVSGIAGHEATGTWAGILAIQGGTSVTSAINGGNLKLNGGGATGGGGAVAGTLLLGTDASLTSAITIGSASVPATFTGTLLAPDGTSGLPAYSFSGKTNMGIRRNGNNLEIYDGAGTLQTTIHASRNAVIATRVICNQFEAGDATVDYNNNGKQLSFVGGNGTVNFGLRFGTVYPMAAASGTQTVVRISSDDYGVGGLVPTGTCATRALEIIYTIDSTASSGVATGIHLNATETSVGAGGHDLMNLKIAAASKFRVDNVGQVYTAVAKVALGGGAAPTLGTIGGSGPTAAAQSGWKKEVLNGTTVWTPVWV